MNGSTVKKNLYFQMFEKVTERICKWRASNCTHISLPWYFFKTSFFCLIFVATLTLTLLDVNDEPPEFLPGPQYHVNVSEGREVNDLVITVAAVDKDKKQTVFYRIGQDDINSFQIMDSRVGQFILF